MNSRGRAARSNSSLMGKKRRGEDERCLQNGSSSSRMSPEAEEIPREPSLETILQQMVHVMSMNTEILRQMQVKDEKLRKIEEKYEKKLKKVKEKNGKKFEEMEKKLEKQNNDCEVMKEKLEELKDIAVVRSSCYPSPAQRTQPDQGQQARLNLKILSKVQDIIYKGKIIQTETKDCVQVQLFDGALKISHDHPLSSATVQLVILKEEFNKGGQKYWSEDEFMEGQKRHGEGNTPMRIKNSTFNLTAGYACHAKAIILDNSNRKEVKLGVKLVGHHEERVLEGISNLFRVQEAKTEPKKERIPAANGQQQQVPMNNSLQHTIARSASENGNIFASNRQQQSYLQVPLNNWPLPTFARSEEHGHGEPLQTPQDFDQPHNSYLPAIWGGNDLCMLPGFQTQSTSQQNVLYPERAEYAGDLHPQTQNQVIPNLQSGNGGSIILKRVQLLLDEPNMVPRQWWNILDKLMPLFPDKCLVHEYDKSLASDYFLKTMMRVHGTMGIANGGMRRHHNRGVLIQSLEDSDSEHEPPLKRKRQASYQLRFVNKACREYYIWGQIKAEDGGLLKVALYNEDSLRITSGPLSSASVEIVLLHGDFNADGQDYWSPEEFGNYILSPLSVEEPPALSGDCVLTLVDGEASLSSASFQKTSSFARTGKFTMGVKMKTTLEERVQEGITQPFLVQVRQGEGSNYTCRPSDLAGGLTKLSEEVCTSLDRGSFLTAQDKFTRLHPGDEGNICTTLAAELISGKQASGAANLWEHAAKLNEKPLMQLMLVMMLSSIAPYIYFGADDELVARLCRTSVYYNAMVFALSRFTVILLLNMKFFGKKTILDLRLTLIVMFDMLAVYVSDLSTVKLGPMSLMIFLVSGLLLLLCWLYAKWSTSRKYNLIENKTLPRIPHGCIQTEKYQDAKHLTFGMQASGAASCLLVAGHQQEEVTANRFSVKSVEKMIKVVKVSWLFLVEAPKKIKEGFRDYLRKPARSGEITIYMLMSVTMPLAVVLYFCFTAQLCRASMYCSATALALSLWAAMLLFNKVTPELRLVLLTDMHTPCLGAIPFMESPNKSMIVAFLWSFVTDSLFVDYRSHQGTIV